DEHLDVTAERAADVAQLLGEDRAPVLELGQRLRERPAEAGPHPGGQDDDLGRVAHGVSFRLSLRLADERSTAPTLPTGTPSTAHAARARARRPAAARGCRRAPGRPAGGRGRSSAARARPTG